MSRIVRPLLATLCLLTLGFAAAPGFAQAGPIPAAAFAAPIKLIQEVDVVGAGATETEALNNALATLNANYRVLRYTATNSFCTEVEIPTGLNTYDTITLCSVQVHAWVLFKAIVLGH
jgi:hypothetical protein